LETQCESLDNVEKYYMWTVEYTSLQSPATELCIIIIIIITHVLITVTLSQKRRGTLHSQQRKLSQLHLQRNVLNSCWKVRNDRGARMADSRLCSDNRESPVTQYFTYFIEMDKAGL